MILKPSDKSNVKNTNRHADGSQLTPDADRPQLPQDASRGGENYFRPGQMPKGFTGVWCFDGGTNTKKSPTSGGGKKIY